MFKNIYNWSKFIHQPIFETARWDHVVYIEISSRSIIRKTVRGLVVVWKDTELLQNFFKAFREAALIKILSQKLLSSLLVNIPASWDPGKEWTATGETSLGPNTAGLSWCTMPGVSVYHESSWSMSNWKIFFIRSVQFCILAAGWVCRVIVSTNWIWPSQSIGIRS